MKARVKTGAPIESRMPCSFHDTPTANWSKTATTSPSGSARPKRVWYSRIVSATS